LILRKHCHRVPSKRARPLNQSITRTESVIAEVHAGSAKDVDIAVQAAKAALIHPSWKLLPGTERGILMNKLADLIEANKEVLAAVDSWDNGTPINHNAEINSN
jgi:aldehyde dehydrogenase (NAD+)